MKTLIGSIVCCFISLSLSAQIALGEWQTHFSYRNVDKVVYAQDKVYALANRQLFSYSPSDDAVEDYNTLTGLNGNEIKTIAYNREAKALLIVYQDGNMDIMKGDDVVNLSDYKDKSLATDKTIYGVRMYGSYAYISTAMGVMALNMQRMEIIETYILMTVSGGYTPIYDFAVLGENYYMLTSSGIFKGRSSDNLLDTKSWTSFSLGSMGIPSQLLVRQSELYALCGKQLYRLHENAWTLYTQQTAAITSMEAQFDYLILNFAKTTQVRTPEEEILVLESKDHTSIAIHPNGNELYGAAGKDGLVCWKKNASGEYSIENENIVPNGPEINTAWKMFFKDGGLYVTGGGRWGDRYRYDGGIMQYKDYAWSSCVETDSLSSQTGYDFLDILNIAIDPRNANHIYASSWGEGLYEFTEGRLDSIHTYGNSPLVTAVNSNPYHYVRVDGATFDSKGNLWMLNSDPTYGKSGIHILKADGAWLSPKYSNFPASAPSLDDILFHQNGQVWINSERDVYGIFVLDDNGTLENTLDDKTRWITSFIDQDGISVDVFTVHCLVEDKDGTLWIGTNVGPLLLYNPSTVFDKTPSFMRVKVPRNDGTNEADYLLTNDRIYAIAVDGANRKWLGTSNDGVYLLSADGITTLHHFTVDNSPLPSNVVYSLAIDPESGEVFIGTEGGLVSYRSDASEGESSYSQVYAFPNPVRPEYQGRITVTGLMEDSQVSITDLAGNVLSKGTSLGGQYTWSGYNAQGKRVGSGVYLVFAADANGEQSVVCKIMIIN